MSCPFFSFKLLAPPFDDRLLSGLLSLMPIFFPSTCGNRPLTEKELIFLPIAASFLPLPGRHSASRGAAFASMIYVLIAPASIGVVFFSMRPAFTPLPVSGMSFSLLSLELAKAPDDFFLNLFIDPFFFFPP